ncbi:MAG: hypothetical protein J0I99_02480 [Devosia sp.]|uniref:hypothetical protein n=1 Tax=Devosia sp. TaxID=1871048 RepID=UPI001AD5AA36|nr:hypothetical protein [Devosia sp.]MBN9310145.1 hypothetical protein [Devosia sp.]MBN9314584.1 hypothetical protein [Devosia sp.]
MTTFKYGLTLEAQGGNKLRRFKAWAKQHVPDLEYRLPPQTPIETTTMTIRLRSLEDIQRVQGALSGSLP